MDAEISARPDSIPLVLLTGFLGAGKTTLLNRLVNRPELADSAVLINEIGEIALDHLLVQAGGETVVALDSGCLCCVLRGEFVSALEDLLRARDNHRLPPFARLIVETTGLADPVPLMQSVIGHPYLSLRFEPIAIITVVDAVNGPATLLAHEEARRQVALADRIVLSKRDLGDDAPVRAAIAAINPGADVVDAASDAALDLPPGGPAGTLAAELARYPGDAGSVHADDVRSFVVTSEVALSPRALDLFLMLLRGVHGPNLLRLKGLVRLSDDPERPMLLQGAQAIFHAPLRLDAWPDEDHRTRLVIVGKALPPETIERIYLAFSGARVGDPAG